MKSIKKCMIILIIFILTGCSSKGNIKIINNTDHYLYFTIDNIDYFLKGSPDSDPTKTISVNTGARYLFFGSADKEVDLHLEGETFMMQKSDEYGNPLGEYQTETSLLVKPNETTNVYTNPTHAGTKLVNDTNNQIDEFRYIKNSVETVQIITEPLAAGDSVYCRLEPSTPDIPISYVFEYRFEGDQNYHSTIATNSLYVDDQYRISAFDYR
ncbi:MAG: hypothetical protein H8E57_05470 [Candidatus Cloacimonetes bacterium]|nr:hypothetical protein [Candidatus Cloacimonadota bacterium]